MSVPRKPVTLGTKYLVLLCQAICAECKQPLGKEKVNFDHRPALWERFYDVATGEYTPPANDHRYIEALHESCHRKRTHGTPATTLGSDSHRRAKDKRVKQKVSEHLDRMRNKGNPDKERKSKWPKRKFGS